MTLGEMIEEVYMQLGKPTNRNPYADDGETVDIGSSGATTLTRWLNRGYRRILTWRFPRGEIVRFRSTEREVFFSGVAVSGTAAAGDSETITLDASAEADADRYNGWAIEITGGTGSGQKRLIVDYAATRVATVHKAWDTVPDATSEYEMKKNRYDFVGASHEWAADNIVLSATSAILSVLQVIDMNSGSRLVRADRVEDFNEVWQSLGNAPSVFSDKDGGLVFDSPVPEGRYYRLKYIGLPDALSAVGDEPSIPEHFHEAVVLWAVWWGLREMQEFAGAYSTKRDLEDTMKTALGQFARGNERDDISLYMEEAYGPY